MWIGVIWVEDVMVEIRADRNRLQRHIAEVDESLRWKARLGHRVVLEVQIGCDIE